MTTSGAPLLAEMAVWNLSYSSPPAPAFVQQTWTSSWSLLKLSTTFSVFGYQAQSVTTGASFFWILLVQLASLLPLPFDASVLFAPPPPEHPASAPATSRLTATAMTFFLFTV